MTSGRLRFDRFVLDARERLLTRDGKPVEISGRYLDALALMAREEGRLVTKERFLDEVWKGVPVTEEALTQCIRTLRRILGDSAVSPRYIETVVKHGYRFIAPITVDAPDSPLPVALAQPADIPAHPWRDFFGTGMAASLGAGAAGALGGTTCGLLVAAQSTGPAGGSVLMVVVFLSAFIGLLGGAGVGFGIAAAGFAPGRPLAATMAGGALGGLAIGAVVKLIGLDAFNILFGRGPGDMTGAPEGAILGAAVGLAAWLADRSPGPLRRNALLAALVTGAAGFAICSLGGHLMAGSLVLLGEQFPESQLQLDGLWRLAGESGFGPVSQAVTGALEGALFGACVVSALLLERRNRPD